MFAMCFFFQKYRVIYSLTFSACYIILCGTRELITFQYLIPPVTRHRSNTLMKLLLLLLIVLLYMLAIKLEEIL